MVTDTEKKVRAILQEYLGVRNVELSDTFAKLGADSLDIVEMIMVLEEEYGFEISDQDVETLRTVADVINYIDKRRGADTMKVVGTEGTERYKKLLEQIEQAFVYHAPKDGQPEKYVKIRDAGKALAVAILENTPMCADQSAAIRKVREAIFTANSAIALDGLI